jgi:hypothetical protein
MKRLIVILAAAMLTPASLAQAMSFNVVTIDSRISKNQSGLIYCFVYGSGEIVEGDAERFFEALQSSHVSQNDDVLLFLDSPGGSLSEGIKLGHSISDFKAKTSVGRQTSDRFKQLPGRCSSACVFAYLGGSYRYLSDDSDLGVHQFSINDNNMQAGKATASSQFAAAQIVEFIKNSCADIQFSTLMTSALPSEIYFVSHDKLRELPW